MHTRYIYRTVILLVTVYLIFVTATICRCRFSGFPAPSVQNILDGSWAAETEDYLKDNIGFHDTLFRMKTKTELFIGERAIQNVYVTDEMLLERIPAKEAPTERSAEILGKFYQTYQLPSYLILVPSAAEVYQNRLPRNAVRMDQESDIRSVYAAVGTGIRCIDACNALSAASDGYIYYRTDSRWTSYGAYCVYQAAMRKMGFTAVPYKRYVISHLSTDFRGNLYERTLYNGVKADVLDLYSCEESVSIENVTAFYADGRVQERGSRLHDQSFLQSEDMYRFYLGEPCEKLVIRTNLDNDKKLLLYKDELADCFIPFLLQHYSEICVVNLEETGLDFEEAADPSAYTQVLFLSDMENWCRLMAS